MRPVKHCGPGKSGLVLHELAIDRVLQPDLAAGGGSFTASKS